MSKCDDEDRMCRREQSRRGLYLYLVVLFVTAGWAAMLYLGGKSIGVPISATWLLAFAGAIFVLLLLGLGMAAVASGNASEDERVLLFDPPAAPIMVSDSPGRSPWQRACQKEFLHTREQSREQDG